MNKAKLKSYAPQARKDFIAAVTARANLLGLSSKAGKLEVAASLPQGDVTVIAGQAWPVKVHSQRDQLITRIKRDGFAQTLEAVAYTWFNRFAALRYMELHDYLGHGHRALSSAAGTLPDLLTHAADLAQSGSLPGLNAPKVLDMKLAGNRDGELYRLLLVAQCNALSRAMPFLFERIDDDSELLLPDNLLRSDSVIAKLVEAIPEEDWAEVEIIGWLYQFYISEKKDQVIGKVVKSEDIPAATQLFTPNWIVQYLVQNSVGRLWLMANPQSTLASEWPYYITPAEQTPEVQAQLDALIQTRVREDGDTPGGVLNPESITVLDPACGSGHILVVAYDVLKAIYLERGYQPRAIPRLILKKNLYGLDIDDRAAQMAGFALLMKARADDRRLFTATDDAGNLQPPKLNVLSLQESKGLNVDELVRSLTPALLPLPLGEGWGEGGFRATITTLVDTFEHAKTFGSLIQIPYALKTHLAVLPQVLALVKQSGDMYASAAADDLLPLVQQAQVLAMQFDAVVANPPYLGTKGTANPLRSFAVEHFPAGKIDLYAQFILRSFSLLKGSGQSAMVAMQSWMFQVFFSNLRQDILTSRSIVSLVQLGARAFSEISGEVVQTAMMVMHAHYIDGHIPVFLNLTNGIEEEKSRLLLSGENRYVGPTQNTFTQIPGAPLAYWTSNKIRGLFSDSEKMSVHLDARQGMATTDNVRFLRYWHEIQFSKIEFHGANTDSKWFPYNKGGEFRKWGGGFSFLVDYENDGNTLIELVRAKYPKISDPEFVIKNRKYYYRPGVTWSDLGSKISARSVSPGFIFDTAGPTAFFDSPTSRTVALSVLNSKVIENLSSILNPGLHFTVGDFNNLPFLNQSDFVKTNEIVNKAVCIAEADWDSYEFSWAFQAVSYVSNSFSPNLSGAWIQWNAYCQSKINEMKIIEEENNALIIEAYDLQDDISPEVPESQITLARADREKDCQRLISYAIGCMMGRYSLDEPGLIYAHAGNVGFEPGRYEKSFPADADGILPITDELWFADDAPSRIREFLHAVWGPDTLEENMAWLAESLGKKSAKEATETPDETIRRYIADKFFKDHLQTYKKRPIYWLFSSGKHTAFQALVYLHRYHEGTLARLRAEYVVPLTGKIQSRIEMLQKDANAASSTAARNKLAKEVEKLKKKHVELLAYDEQLRHYADMRITLDLDDGVKVNYGKFGDLLAEVKAVTGGASDD